MLHKISWEIEVDAKDPLEAAKNARQIMQDDDSDALQFYVQNTETNEIVSVDLCEDDDDAVLPVTNYEQFIK